MSKNLGSNLPATDLNWTVPGKGKPQLDNTSPQSCDQCYPLTFCMFDECSCAVIKLCTFARKLLCHSVKQLCTAAHSVVCKTDCALHDMRYIKQTLQCKHTAPMLQVLRATKLLCNNPCLWFAKRAMISHAVCTPPQGHMLGACHNKNDGCQKGGRACFTSSHVLHVVLHLDSVVIDCDCQPWSCKHVWKGGKRGPWPLQLCICYCFCL